MTLPLNALRAFEAAARHFSFASAAKELEVTPAAVSQQVKKLERCLGAALFVRHNRWVELTPLGSRISRSLSVVLAQLRAVENEAVRAAREGVVPPGTGRYEEQES